MGNPNTLPPVPRGSLIEWITRRPDDVRQYLEAMRAVSRSSNVTLARENAVLGGAAPPPAPVVISSGSDVLATFGWWCAEPPATDYATFDVRASQGCLDFDDTSEEAIYFTGLLPSVAKIASGITVRIVWRASTATSGQVRWGIQFQRLTEADIDSAIFGTATTVDGTAAGTAGVPTVSEVVVTELDDLAAGELYRVKIYRDSTDTTNDTMTGDAELVAVELGPVVS